MQRVTQHGGPDSFETVMHCDQFKKVAREIGILGRKANRGFAYARKHTPRRVARLRGSTKIFLTCARRGRRISVLLGTSQVSERLR